MVVQEGLQEAGYEVIGVSSGKSALDEIDRLGPGLCAVVTDIRMGAGPDGWAVARHAREKNPGIAVVYMSGDSAVDWNAMGVPHSAMLQKPFTISQVVVALANQQNRTDDWA